MQSLGDCHRTFDSDVRRTSTNLRSELRAESRRDGLLGIHGVVSRIRSGAAVRAPEVQMKNRLRVLRAESNWSQADLAQRLEVSRQSVNAIETGKFDPSLPLAFRLARLFKMPIEQIFIDEDAI
jgi:putative transcriptional regulator